MYYRQVSKNSSMFRAAQLSSLVWVTLAHAGTTANLKVKSLRTEYRQNPFGLDVREPRLSWVLESAHRGEKQTACEIRVASSAELLARGKPDLWASGKVSSLQSQNVTYAGQPLVSEWFYKVLAGINPAPDAVGFDKILIKPQPVGDLKWV